MLAPQKKVAELRLGYENRVGPSKKVAELRLSYENRIETLQNRKKVTIDLRLSYGGVTELQYSLRDVYFVPEPL